MSTRPCARCGTQIAASEYLCWRCRDELPVQGSARVATAAPEPEDATDDGFETLDDLGEPPGPARRTWQGRPIPDGMVLPSRTQYHGTMLALIAIGVVITLTLAVLVNRGVGPFPVTNLRSGTNATSGQAEVSATVRNAGEHAGKARCVALWSSTQGGAQQSSVEVT